MSWWCRWRAVNFEIHLWSSGMNADCIWRSISIQHVQMEAGLNSDPGNDSFRSKSVTLSMLIDLLTSRCRSTQVKLYTGLIASIDLWPQEMFTFSEIWLALSSLSDQWEIRLFFIFRNSFFIQNTASFTMVIKRCPGGAGGGRSTSKSTCEVPAWTMTAFGDRSASSMSK